MGGETKEASLKAVVDRVAERRQQWLEDEGISVPTNLVDGGVKRALKYLEEEEVIASDTKEKMEHVWSESDQQATDAIVSLIHQGVDVKAPDGGGTIALHYAARNGHTEVLSLLLKRGAEVSAQDEDGWTALNLAADNGYVEVLSLLLERGADVAAQDNDGLTALHCAATSGNIKAVSLLLDRNADANAISKEGHNPLSHLILEMRDDPDDSYIAVVRLLSSLHVEPTLDLSLLIKSSTLEKHQLAMLACAQYWQGRQKDKLSLIKVPSEVVAGGEDAVKTYFTEVEKTATGIYRASPMGLTQKEECRLREKVVSKQ